MIPYADLAKTIAHSENLEVFLDLCVYEVHARNVDRNSPEEVSVLVRDCAQMDPIAYDRARAAVAHETGRVHDEALLTVLAEAVAERSAPSEERAQRLEEIARQCVMPQPSSPQNMEVIAMSLSVFVRALKGCGWPDLRDVATAPAARRVVANLGSVVECFDPRDVADVLHFLNRWHESVFARLEVSHKLAAAFCLTDIVDSDDIRAPWPAWSLLVPNGLLGEDGPARVWCIGKQPVVLVFPARDEKGAGLASWVDTHRRSPVNAAMVLSLVLSTCIALNDPERERVQKTGSWGVQPKAPRRVGAPAEGTRYVLAQPVSIDLRETVLDVLGKRSKGGGSPKAQFLVRGHWRNQAHGPGRSLRTLKWIEPFWKGPEDARILLRSHKVKKEDGDE